MTEQQTQVLAELLRNGCHIIEAHYYDCELKIRFYDKGGNYFNRSYSQEGTFKELE